MRSEGGPSGPPSPFLDARFTAQRARPHTVGQSPKSWVSPTARPRADVGQRFWNPCKLASTHGSAVTRPVFAIVEALVSALVLLIFSIGVFTLLTGSEPSDRSGASPRAGQPAGRAGARAGALPADRGPGESQHHQVRARGRHSAFDRVPVLDGRPVAADVLHAERAVDVPERAGGVERMLGRNRLARLHAGHGHRQLEQHGPTSSGEGLDDRLTAERVAGSEQRHDPRQRRRLRATSGFPASC